MTVDEMLKKASDFLRDNPANEVEIQDGALRVKVTRFTPAPMCWTCQYPYAWNFQLQATKQ